MPVPRPSHTTRSRTLRLAAVAALAAGTGLALTAGPANAGIVDTVDLGTAAEYSVLAGSTVTNIGSSVLDQSVGLSPGPETGITGFPPGIVLPPGTIEADNAATLQAQSDLTIAYDDAAGRDVEFSHPNPDLAGQTLLPGVHAASAMAPLSLSGALVLDGGGNTDAVFIFQTDSTLITSPGSTISLTNGASECNVFWQVGSSATLDTDSVFVGTILALTSISVKTGATVQGRALARNAAVTLDTNVFNQPSCESTAVTTVTTTTVAAATTVATTAPTSETTSPTTVPPSPTTTVSVTDMTLPRTGGSLSTQSGIALVAAMMGLAAVAIARRRQPA